MKKFEIIIKKEGFLKVISLYLDGKETISFSFRNEENNLMTIEHFDVKNNRHYFIEEVTVRKTDYMVYSFVEDLRYIIINLVKKFRDKEYSNYPMEIVDSWAESINNLAYVTELRDKSLPQDGLFRSILSNFLIGELNESVTFTYLFTERDYIYFNSFFINNILLIKKLSNKNGQLEYDNFSFVFRDKINYKNLINLFDKKKKDSYLKTLQELIFTAEKSERKDKFINDLLIEL